MVLFLAMLYGIHQSIQRCKTELTITQYQIETEFSESLRIVQLTDLHSCSFGEDNADLIELVAQQEPDLILMTGDMLDRRDENADVVCTLIEKLCSVAPVYYGYGNHETAWMERTGESLTPVLTEAGATVLDVEYVDITIQGQELRLGGYHGYYRQPGMYSVTQEQREEELSFAEAFENTDRYKLLLCHIPTTWLDWEYIDKYPIDLVLTGHYHGGQIRLPLVGGLYAPYVGWFPPYTEGIYYGEQATCILSTGLGSGPNISRLNNPPRVVVVDLIPQK